MRHLYFFTNQRLNTQGFTLVELTIVIILLGILSVVVLPKLTDNTSFSGLSFRHEVVGAVRYAQKTAVSHRRLVCMTFTSSTVVLTIAASNPAAACGLSLNSPDGSAYSSKNAAITASGTVITNQFLYAQPSGLITTDAAGTTNVIGASGTITITGQADIKIEGATGHVE